MTFDDPTQPFTYAAARGAGISARALAGPEYRRVFPGVHVAAGGDDDLLLRARAAMLIVPSGGTISHHTAARFWGGLVPDDSQIHVAYRRDVRKTEVHGIQLHRFKPDFATTRRYGLRTTTPEQTFVHLTRPLGFLDLVAVGDQMIREGRWTSAPLIQTFVDRWEGQGRGAARFAAEFLRTGVDSVPESKLRLLMVLGGLPEPKVNHLITADGQVRHRIELAYEEVKLGIEYDGRWHEDPAERAHDKARRGYLSQDLGWTFEIVDADDLFRRPDLTLLRLWSTAQRLGIPVPVSLSDAWRQHFVVRAQAHSA